MSGEWQDRRLFHINNREKIKYLVYSFNLMTRRFVIAFADRQK